MKELEALEIIRALADGINPGSEASVSSASLEPLSVSGRNSRSTA